MAMTAERAREFRYTLQPRPRLLNAYDALLQEESRPGERTDLLYNVQEVKQVTGNASQRAARVLRNKRPDLLEMVVAGELSWHAAMIEGGFRKRRGAMSPTCPARFGFMSTRRTRFAKRFGTGCLMRATFGPFSTTFGTFQIPSPRG